MWLSLIQGILCPLTRNKLLGIQPISTKNTEYYLKVFRRLEEQAIEQDKKLFGYIVAHEAAIKRFASIELVSGNNSLDPITTLLND